MRAVFGYDIVLRLVPFFVFFLCFGGVAGRSVLGRQVCVCAVVTGGQAKTDPARQGGDVAGQARRAETDGQKKVKHKYNTLLMNTHSL